MHPSLPSFLSNSGSVHGGLPIGSRVMVDAKHGAVKYVGTPAFDTGTFIGVELDDHSGRNDGSVDGVAYFTCEMGKGIFVRPGRVTFRGINCATLVA